MNSRSIRSVSAAAAAAPSTGAESDEEEDDFARDRRDSLRSEEVERHAPETAYYLECLEERIKEVKEEVRKEFSREMDVLKGQVEAFVTKLEQAAQQTAATINGVYERIGEERTQIDEQSKVNVDECSKQLQELMQGKDTHTHAKLNSKTGALEEALRRSEEDLRTCLQVQNSLLKEELGDVIKTQDSRLTEGLRELGSRLGELQAQQSSALSRLSELSQKSDGLEEDARQSREQLGILSKRIQEQGDSLESLESASKEAAGELTQLRSSMVADASAKAVEVRESRASTPTESMRTSVGNKLRRRSTRLSLVPAIHDLNAALRACGGVSLESKDCGVDAEKALTYALTASTNPLLDPAESDNHLNLVRELWKDKAGSILEELCNNLKQPKEGDRRRAEALTPKLFARVCAFLLGKNAANTLNPDLPHQPLAIACWALYTMTDVDIDNLLGFECPVLPDDRQAPAERDEFFSEYRQEYKDERNPQMYQAASWGARITYDELEKRRQGDQDQPSFNMSMSSQTVESLGKLNSWVKWLCFLGASALTLEEPMKLTRGLCDLPHHLVQQLSGMKKGERIYWAAPSSATDDPSISRSYMQQKQPRDRNVLFTIMDVTEALQLVKLSKYPKEREFLLPPFSVLKVMSVHDRRPLDSLEIECEFVGCKMPPDFREECLADLATASQSLNKELQEMGIDASSLESQARWKTVLEHREGVQESQGRVLELRREVDEGLSKVHAKLEDGQARLASSLEQTHRALEERIKFNEEAASEVCEIARDARADVKKIENVSTGRVDWVIQGASRQIEHPRPLVSEDGYVEPSCSSYFSPTFDAAGALHLKLELRVYRPVCPAVEGQERGDCALVLTAPGGTHVACALSVGAASQVFEKRFGADGDSFITGRLCFVKEQIDLKTDRLCVSVEVLESVYSFEQPPAPGADDRHAQSQKEPDGSLLVLHRRVNNRILQQVRSQVDHLKSCTVRRVEWRLQDADRMRLLFPRGSPVRSRKFDAGGLEGMRLFFYPSGVDGAADGYCSLFLRAVGGASVRGWLEAGPERRKLSQTWDREGQCGRMNFCLFESCVDPEDRAVLLALDIEEVAQDFSFSAARGSDPPALGIQALGEDWEAREAISGVLKLHCSPIRSLVESQEGRALPAIAAPRSAPEAAPRLRGSSSHGSLQASSSHSSLRAAAGKRTRAH